MALVLRLGGDAVVVGEVAHSEAPPAGAAAGQGRSGREAYRRVRLELVANQQKLREVWEREIRPLPPAARERWLDSPDAAVALGAKHARKLLKTLRKQRRAVSLIVPGGAWLLAYELEGIHLPIDAPDAPQSRRHAVRMVLSEQETSLGDGPRHRRYLPPQCRAEEDFIDGQDEVTAFFYPHPKSPSARAIWRIGFYGRRDSKPIRGSRRSSGVMG